MGPASRHRDPHLTAQPPHGVFGPSLRLSGRTMMCSAILTWKLGNEDSWSYDEQDAKAEKKFLRPINPDPVKAIAKEVHRGRPKTAR